MNAESSLDEIDRIHDDHPERAAAGLRALDAVTLPAERLPLLAFLWAHVVGEKLGAWEEAAARLEQLRASLAEAPLALVVHAAVAAHCAGRADNPALATLAAAGGKQEAEVLVRLNALDRRPPADAAALAAALTRLAAQAAAFDAGNKLNQRLAIAFNNATTRLLDLARGPADGSTAAALRDGSAAALRFWQAAGTWVNVERALYLRALVFNRIGEPAAARDVCRQALDIIDAHGDEAVDRVFLQLQLAAALLRLGEAAAGNDRLAEARAAAAGWDDPGLRSWFADEHDRLFGGGQEVP